MRAALLWHFLDNVASGKKPTFYEIYHDLYDRHYDPKDNVVLNFTNPYNVHPEFDNFPHSNLVEEREVRFPFLDQNS